MESAVIGFIIFIVLIAAQVVVITKGATRIAEVAARFTLDKMPAKQMAVESEFNSGAINEEEMKRRKDEIDRESGFYGAMDGASKFVSGNVKIGILITAVNILGGVIIGTVLRGEPLSRAFSVYVRFAIGDGLLSQLPALLVSTAAGLIVTRSVSGGTFAEDVSDEFTRQPRIYWIAAAVLLLFAIIPGFPHLILILMSAVFAFFAYRLGRTGRGGRTAKAAIAKDTGNDEKKRAEENAVPPLDPLSLELGFGLVPLVDESKGGGLLERVKRLRRETALDLGLVIPKVRIFDNVSLDPAEYRVKIRGADVGRGSVRMNRCLCLDPGGAGADLAGERVADPVSGLPAVWVDAETRAEAERAGLTVADPPSVIAAHLADVIRTHASEILGRQEVKGILDGLREEYSAVVEDALKAVSLGEIQKTLQALLRERVSIRDMVTILEAVADAAAFSKDIQFLTEKARQALGRQICLRYADEGRKLHVLSIERGLEETIIAGAEAGAGGRVSALAPAVRAAWVKALSASLADAKEQGFASPVVLCSEAARVLVKQSVERELPGLAVLSPLEIADVEAVPIGEIRL
jgi:flagellar biosynthesis protein FlhA